MIDTGDIAAVPEDQQLEVDEGADSNALEGGNDFPTEAYENPGEVIEEDLA